MALTPTLLRECGEALYGPRWQSEMSRDLDVDDRTIRRWVAGDSSIPEGVAVDLLRLVMERAQTLDDLVPRLRRGE